MAVNEKKKVLTRKQYKDILSVIDKCSPRKAPKELKLQFPHIDELTLWSIDNVQYTEKMKKNTWLLKTENKFLRQIHQPYTKLSPHDTGGLLRIADKVNISPALVAKRLLEYLYSELSNQIAVQSPTAQPPTATYQATDTPNAHQTPDMPTTHQAADMPTAHQSADMLTTHQATDMLTTHQATDMPTTHQATDMPTTHQATDMPSTSEPPVASDTQCSNPASHVGNHANVDQSKDNNGASRNISPLRQLMECVISRKLQVKWHLSSSLDSDGSCVHTAELSVGLKTEFSHFKAVGQSQRAARMTAAVKALNVLQGGGDCELAARLDKQLSITHPHSSGAQSTDATPSCPEEPIKKGSATTSSKQALSSKKMISWWLKQPQHIPDKQLSEQVAACVVNDTQYGPIAMALHTNIGSEYERKLIEEVKAHKLHYEDENMLRKRGYDKTPDVKLIVPIAVDGKVVNWIESKASFGDERSHKRYLDDQLWSYWNRFGPGLVIYWFGYVSEILDCESEGILISHQFPQTFVTMETMENKILPFNQS